MVPCQDSPVDWQLDLGQCHRRYETHSGTEVCHLHQKAADLAHSHQVLCAAPPESVWCKKRKLINMPVSKKSHFIKHLPYNHQYYYYYYFQFSLTNQFFPWDYCKLGWGPPIGHPKKNRWALLVLDSVQARSSSQHPTNGFKHNHCILIWIKIAKLQRILQRWGGHTIWR